MAEATQAVRAREARWEGAVAAAPGYARAESAAGMSALLAATARTALTRPFSWRRDFVDRARDGPAPGAHSRSRLLGVLLDRPVRHLLRWRRRDARHLGAFRWRCRRGFHARGRAMDRDDDRRRRGRQLDHRGPRRAQGARGARRAGGARRQPGALADRSAHPGDGPDHAAHRDDQPARVRRASR